MNDESDKREGESEEEWVARLQKMTDDFNWENLARDSIQKLREIIENSEQDASVVKAIGMVLDRAYGKPLEKVEHSGEVTIIKEIEEEQLKRFAKRHVKGKINS